MKKLYPVLILVIFALVSCTKEESEDPAGKKSLIDMIEVPSGSNCLNGGYKVNSGVDANANGKLDVNEIETTNYICNEINGNNSLVALVQEPAGPNCANGGYKINTGIDVNNNNTLDVNEVLSAQYVCNGLAGNNSLIALSAEPPGVNCATGGYKINTGADVNKNSILDATEIQATNYICNGNNGPASLINIKSEPEGDNCVFGGYSFSTGIDINKNGVLDAGEVTKTDFVCNSPTPKTALVVIIHDDGTVDDENVVNLLDSYGFKCGFALIANNFNKSTARYLAHQAAGYEILSHSYNHYRFEGTRAPVITTDEEAELQFKTSYNRLISAGFLIKGWVTPYNNMNPAFINVLKKYYAYGFIGLQAPPADSTDATLLNNSMPFVKRVSMENNTTEKIITGIDATIASKGILFLYAHEYPKADVLPVEKYREILDYLKQKSNAKLCEVLPPYLAIRKYTQWNEVINL